MKIIAYVLWIIIIVLGLSFAGLNATWVPFNYYVHTVTLPLSLLLGLAFFLGGILGLVSSLVVIVRCKRDNRRLKKRLKSTDDACDAS